MHAASRCRRASRLISMLLALIAAHLTGDHWPRPRTNARWSVDSGTLHAVRSALGVAATLVYLWAIL